MRRTLLILVLMLIPPAVTAAVIHAREYPRRFAEVLPEKIYRGGFPTGDQLRRLQNENNVRTVVSMTGPTNRPGDLEMVETCRELGLRHLRFPMPGNGCGDFADMDRAADAVANESNWPVYFHCQAGKQRSNAVTAAYRLKHCHWTLEQALKELEQEHDLDPIEEAELVEHVKHYADWIASGRKTNTPNDASASVGSTARPTAER